MGQYHVATNLSKREFLYTHALVYGLKLVEQAGSGPGGIGSALILLLAASNGYGGGDFDTADPIYDLCGTPKEISERATHLAAYAEKSGRPEDAEQAVRLRTIEPYRDITSLVRDYLEREGISVYGRGEGRIPRSLPY